MCKASSAQDPIPIECTSWSEADGRLHVTAEWEYSVVAVQHAERVALGASVASKPTLAFASTSAALTVATTIVVTIWRQQIAPIAAPARLALTDTVITDAVSRAAVGAARAQ